MRWLIRYDGLSCQYYIKGKRKRKQSIHETELAEKLSTGKKLRKKLLNLVVGNSIIRNSLKLLMSFHILKGKKKYKQIFSFFYYLFINHSSGMHL